MAKFEPTNEQREDVAIMSAGRLSQEEIAKSIVNPRTGRGISVKVLRRLFKKELAEDTELKKEIIAQYREMVRERHPWAIKFGMENIVGFADGAAAATATSSGSDAMARGITVRFVRSPYADEPPALDITPRPTLPGPESASHRPPADAVNGSPSNNRLRPDFAPWPRAEPLPPPPGPRTELDDPNLRGKAYHGPLQWGGKPRKGFP